MLRSSPAQWLRLALSPQGSRTSPKSCWRRRRCEDTSGWTGSPDGLPTWGDGRLFVLGTEGTIEVRKNLDLAGRAGSDHLFLVTRRETRHIDCSRMEVAYYRDFAADVAERTERAMPQAQVFAVCRLALLAQNQAARFAPVSAER